MLEFDSWQRCETVRHLLNWALPDPGKVLDVGGYPGRLKGMIPQHDWVICDLRVDAPGDQMRGNAVHLPIRDQSFDMAVSLDVLEHIEPADRPAVLQEMIRVSRMGLIVTFPHRHPLVEAGEKRVGDAYRNLHQKDHPWLAEHARYPLPDVEEVMQYLQSFGGQVAAFDIGDITRWTFLQLADVLLEAIPGGLDLAGLIDRFYQEKLYIHDFKQPAYRKIVLHMFHMDEPISLSMIETSRAEQAADDLIIYGFFAYGLLDLLKKELPSLQPAKAEAPKPVQAQEAPRSGEEKPAEEPKTPSPETVKPEAFDQYIYRLETGLQAWEETYSAALNEMTGAHRWRNNLEQRRSFRLYKRIMRLLGSRVDP